MCSEGCKSESAIAPLMSNTTLDVIIDSKILINLEINPSAV
jgi:hypothetical protein